MQYNAEWTTLTINPDTFSTDAGRSSWITTVKDENGKRHNLWFTPLGAGYEQAKRDRLAMKAGRFHGCRMYRGVRYAIAVNGRRVTIRQGERTRP